MKKHIILAVAIVSFALNIHAQKLQELDAYGYKELSKNSIAFVNFNRPTCDMAEYYNISIEKLNDYVTNIPIYYFNKDNYPEIEKEYELWGASKLALVRNGKFVEEYKGAHGRNNMAKWMVDNWNATNNTNLPLPRTRYTPGTHTQAVDVEVHKQLDLRFDGNGIDKLTGEEKFHAPIGNVEYENNCIRSNGLYNNETNSFTRYNKDIKSTEFSAFFEFMPFTTSFNNILSGNRGSRFFSIEVIDKKLCFAFANGEWCYILDETTIEGYNWYAVAFSFNYANRKLEVVLNGRQLQGIQLSPTVAIKEEGATFGLCNFGSGSVYEGYMNNLRVYNKSFMNGDLIRLYDIQRTHFPDMTKYFPKDKIADFPFTTLMNTVSGKEELKLQSDYSKLINGHLQLASYAKGGNPSINTAKLKGFSPDQYTLYFDIMPNTLGDYNFQYMVGLQSGYWRLLTLKTTGTEIGVEFKTKEKPQSLTTQGANLTLDRWQNIILSVDKTKRQVIMAIDGRIVLDTTFTTHKAFELMDDNVHVSFTDFGNPHTYSGKFDNLKVYRRSCTAKQMQTFYSSRGEVFE